MRVVIIDDIKSTGETLSKMLSEMPAVQVEGVFNNTAIAYNFLKTEPVDVIIIDINIPEENGIAFAKRVRELTPSLMIIIISATNDYALEAFDIYALDYIVKPVSRERLERTINRIREILNVISGCRHCGIKYRLYAYCLGDFTLRSADGEAIRLQSSKSEELLAFLLFNRGKAVDKWRIIEELFAEMPIYNAETYLNTTTYKLRKALEPYGMKDAVICRNGSYKIDIEKIYVDFIDFQNRIRVSTPIDMSSLKEALELESLYAGELFGDKDYFWLRTDRERLFLAYWSFAKQLSKKLVESGKHTLALELLKRIEDHDPYDEEVNTLLMKVYAALRDRISMKRQYERYVGLVYKELGIVPEDSFKRFYDGLKESL